MSGFSQLSLSQVDFPLFIIFIIIIVVIIIINFYKPDGSSHHNFSHNSDQILDNDNDNDNPAQWHNDNDHDNDNPAPLDRRSDGSVSPLLLVHPRPGLQRLHTEGQHQHVNFNNSHCHCLRSDGDTHIRSTMIYNMIYTIILGVKQWPGTGTPPLYIYAPPWYL